MRVHSSAKCSYVRVDVIMRGGERERESGGREERERERRERGADINGTLFTSNAEKSASTRPGSFMSTPRLAATSFFVITSRFSDRSALNSSVGKDK